MANTSIVSSLFSQVLFSMKSSSGEKWAVKLNVSRVSIRLSSRPMRHSLESGNTVVDTRIIEPTSLDVDVFCQTLDDVDSVNKLLRDRSNFYTITTKGLVFSAMMLQNERLTQAPTVLSAVPINLTFKEVIIHSATPVIFKQPADSSLVSLGIASLKTAQQNVSDLVSAVKSSSLVTGISKLL
jgi:hypothetical protein